MTTIQSDNPQDSLIQPEPASPANSPPATAIVAEQPAPVPPEFEVGITIFENKRSNTAMLDSNGNPKAWRVPWARWATELSRARPHETKDEANLYALALFRGNKRKDDLLLHSYGIGIDYDSKTPETTTSIDDAASLWAPYLGVLHTSFNHLLEKQDNGYIGANPRFRVVIPYSRPVTGGEHRRVFAWCARLAEEAGHVIDPACKDPGRIWYGPSCPPAMMDRFEYRSLTGAPLDVDAILTEVPQAEGKTSEPGTATAASQDERTRRATAYAKKAKPAVAGDEGHTQTFKVAIVVTRGFDLPESAALDILREHFNPRCQPPWSEDELAHKVHDAAISVGERGFMLGRAKKPFLKLGDDYECAKVHLGTFPEEPVFCEGSSYRYEGGIWHPLSDSQQVRAIGDLLHAAPVAAGENETRPLAMSTNKAEAILKMAQHRTAEPTFFAEAPRALVFANGTLVVREGRSVLEPHAPEHRARFAHPFPHDATSEPVRFLAFLASLWPDDPEQAAKISFLAEFTGACLFGLAPRYKRCLLLYGNSDSGKSTLLDMIEGIFPTDTVSTVPFHEWSSGPGGGEYNRFALVGKLLNVTAEVPAREMLESASFKAIVAGDTTSARNPYGPVVKFRPICGHIAAANTLPSVADESDAVRRRFVVLRMEQRFAESAGAVVGAQQAKIGLAREILDVERGAILAWAVRGLERLLERGHHAKLASSDTLTHEWLMEARPLYNFVAEELEVDPGPFVPGCRDGIATDIVYQRYQEWCPENGMRLPLSKPIFSKQIAPYLAKLTALPQSQVHGRQRDKTLGGREVRFLRGVKLRPAFLPVIPHDYSLSPDDPLAPANRSS